MESSSNSDTDADFAVARQGQGRGAETIFTTASDESDGTHSEENMGRQTILNTATDESDESLSEINEGREDEQPFSETESDLDEVVLSVYWKGGKLGAAMYSVENPVVNVMNDVIDDFILGFKVLKNLFLQQQPTNVVTCKSMPQRFIHLLNNLISGIGDDEPVGGPLHHNLHLYPDAEFRHQNSLRRVFALRLPEEPDDYPEEEHKIFIRTVLDTNQDSMINAFARLLKYIDSNLAIKVANNPNPILAIRAMCIEDLVWVNQETYEALQIFSHLSHPSLFKWTSGVHKEGLSIYGLFNRCHSKLGSRFMRSLLLQPTTNLEELAKRHEVIMFAINPHHEDVINKMQNCIGQVQNIAGMLPRLLAAQATVPQWKTLKKTIHNVLLLREMCSQYANEVVFFEKANSVISEDLYRVGQLMTRVIDFQTSELLKRFVVMPGIDEELDAMKRTYENLTDMMCQISPLELEDMPLHVQECSVMYIPEIGFLVSVPMWKENLSKEEMCIPGFELKFYANKVIHYKSPRCRELDLNVGDVSLLISDLELRLMLSLVQYIQNHISTLLNSISFVGELDWKVLLALGSVAKELSCVKPQITNGHEILIDKGRHPLQELCVSNFVPNDTYSSEEHSLIKILTGPNASGKSVYLKQVALIVYLAHTGSFVPANKAVIGLVDQIHTRIQTRESIATQLSAFMIDLRQMQTSVRLSTRSSLIIVDEFGKGTAEVDGLALLTAYVTHLVKRGPQACPHVFISTHFHRLIDMLENSPLIKTQVLHHIMSDGDLVYLYQLKTGQINTSMALQVAQANSLSECHVNRAQEVLRALRGAPAGTPLKNHKKMQPSRKVKEFTEWSLDVNPNQEGEIEEFKKQIQSC